MDKQEVFTKVATHLLTQKRRAEVLRSDGILRCSYRATSADGTVLKCAVGCLIADSAYNPEIEGKRAGHKEVVQALSYSGIDTFHDPIMLPMLESLQAIHDHYKPTNWYERLESIADRLVLRMPAIPK